MAAPTKAQADVELVDRCGGILASAGRSTVTDGTNPNTVGPLREALASLGYSVASFGAVTDADLSAVADSQIPQLLDVAELRLLRNAWGWYSKVDQRISLGQQALGQIRSGLQATILELAERCRRVYGYGHGTIAGGAVDLGFAQVDPDQDTPLDLWDT